MRPKDSDKDITQFVFILSHSLFISTLFRSLLDERFTHGIYRGSYRHEPDLDQVMHRAVETGVKHVILTAGTVTESRLAVEKAREWKMLYPDIQFSSTVGVHPTRCQQVFEEAGQSGGDAPVADDLLKELLDIALDGMKDGTVVAVGEIGLDYDRLEFCPADVQQKYFVRQLETLATRTGLPLFLHNRAVGDDLYKILSEHQDCWKAGGGVVHSFDDSTELAMKFIDDLGLYIGLNGCSLRTDDNLETARQLPLSSILLETEYVS